MAFEPGPCLGLSSTLFLGWERRRFLPFLCLGFGRRRTVAGRATFLIPYNFLPFQPDRSLLDPPRGKLVAAACLPHAWI